MFLGIDIGTSEVKVLLLADDGSAVATAGTPLSISRPHPGHSEQDPAEWWQATQSALAQLRAAEPQAYAATRAIGLSGQMHGAVLLDAKDRVLRPAILWNDTRSAVEAEELMAELPTLPQIAGSLIVPGFTSPKLRWVQKHEPVIFAQVAKVLLPKDYLRLQLTGDYVSDLSDASGTAWLDVARRAWSDELLALSDLTRAQMPDVVEGSMVSGKLGGAAAAALGLPPGIAVAGGAGDNASSAIGMGAVEAGQGFISLGTSGVVFVVTPRYLPDTARATHAFCHAVPGRWHQMSVMLSAASCLTWATRLVGAASEGALEAQARSLSLAARETGPIFLPYLGGERTPHNDANVRASFHGLSHDTDAAALAYGVIEGVSFGLMDGLAALRAAGSTVGRLSLVGGGARSAFWAQLLASLLQVEIVTHADSAAGGALGAARLAWLSTGAEIGEVCSEPAASREYRPDATEHAVLAPRYQRYTAIYPALRGIG
ncbi:MAG: xylulokinase [Proteobacteria bacterium]|nr:xylulokinase [Pseudomonadota bacterium]